MPIEISYFCHSFWILPEIRINLILAPLHDVSIEDTVLSAPTLHDLSWEGSIDIRSKYYQLNPCKERPASRTSTLALTTWETGREGKSPSTYQDELEEICRKPGRSLETLMLTVREKQAVSVIKRRLERKELWPYLYRFWYIHID